MVSFHVLLLDRAGNNLVNADFSLYLGHIFTVKHIYLTLYIEYMCRIAPIYSVHLYLLALLAVAVVPPARSVPAARRARLPAPVCASADAWSTVDFLVRRPCAACLACPLSVCVWARVLAVLACSRACLLPCLSAPVVRAYIVASPAVLLLAVLLSPPAANFFEIVFKPSISIPPSSA